MVKDNVSKGLDFKVLWLLGMHRSGTSLTANWLHKCGLDMGPSFIKADVGNVHGYYEDQEIVKFHKEIIRDNNLLNDVQIQQRLNFSEAHRQTAREIINKRKALDELIIWKDPRTCLTIDLWNELMPDNVAIILFRHYNEVVDSLVRRKAKAEKKRRNFIQGYFNYLTRNKYSKKGYTNSLLESWVHHNKNILAYIEKKKECEYIILSPDQLQENSIEILELINTKFRLNLEYYPFEQVFDNSLYKKETPQYEYSKDTLDRAEEVLKKLEDLKTHQ